MAMEETTQTNTIIHVLNVKFYSMNFGCVKKKEIFLKLEFRLFFGCTYLYILFIIKYGRGELLSKSGSSFYKYWKQCRKREAQCRE